ncbi:hypothetical protein AQ616_02495 [Oceanobacillus sp. E9]|uniref:hypothetical protein n=1 Tax=Oceanobacillus sp. E9 TaxID=1742575 RepID=UPI00084E668B|nr:hypothetical protein [Oceanobacillus sp. E9]OEH56406.1 hypothetical protein AQ616_02495 [Oceanobacillus sp. E9]
MDFKEKLIMPNGISNLLTTEMLQDIEKVAFSKGNKEKSVELKFIIVDDSINLTYKEKVIGIYNENGQLSQLLTENEFILLYIIRMNFYTGLTMKVVPKPWVIGETLTSYLTLPRTIEIFV